MSRALTIQLFANVPYVGQHALEELMLEHVTRESSFVKNPSFKTDTLFHTYPFGGIRLQTYIKASGLNQIAVHAV